MNSNLTTHKDLEIWKTAVVFVTEIYDVTKDFPEAERSGLQSQIRMAAVSLPANIAEGAARQTKREFTQFLYIGIGSLSDLETLLIIAKNLKLVES